MFYRYDSEDDETVQQLKDLQHQYELKLKTNSKGKTGRLTAKVPVLPRGFINGQIRLTRGAQEKHVVQDFKMNKLDKRSNKTGKKLKKQIETDIKNFKNKKPKPPYWLELMFNVFKRKKKKKESKGELMNKLRGNTNKVDAALKKTDDVKKNEKEKENDGDAKEGDAKEGDTKEGDTKEGDVKEGEGDGETKEGETKEGETKAKEEKGVESGADEKKKEEEEEEDEYDPMAEFLKLHGDEAATEITEQDQIAADTLKNFNRYVVQCKDKYKVIIGDVPSHGKFFTNKGGPSCVLLADFSSLVCFDSFCVTFMHYIVFFF